MASLMVAVAILRATTVPSCTAARSSNTPRRWKSNVISVRTSFYEDNYIVSNVKD